MNECPIWRNLEMARKAVIDSCRVPWSDAIRLEDGDKENLF